MRRSAHLRFRRLGRTLALSNVCASLVLAWSPVALGGMPSPPRSVPVGQSFTLAQATPPAPASVDELRAAIEEIKAKLARQRAARPEAGSTTGLADQLRAAGERTAELTRSLEALRAERDDLRQQLGAFEQAAEKSEAAVAELGKQLQEAQAGTTTRVAALEQRLHDVDQAREGALARANELQKELAGLQTARAASDEVVERARADAAEANHARDELSRVLAERETDINRLSGSVSQLRADLADREAKLAAAQSDAGELKRTVEAATAAQTQLRSELEKARDDAEAQARQRADAMAADVRAARDRATKLDEEIGALRSIASSSVKEVQNLGEQLLQALEENQELVAAVGELRATKELLDGELAASRRDLDAANAKLAAEPAAVAAAAPNANGELALVRLQADDLTVAEGDDQASDIAAVLSNIDLTETGDGWLMTVPKDLQFRPGSDEIAEGSEGSLQKVADLIRGYGTPAVRIVGHTDAEGDAAFNRRLSQRRAQAVREFLVAQFAVEPRLITTEGYGEARPLASNDTIAGRRQNRRVEVYVKP